MPIPYTGHVRVLPNPATAGRWAVRLARFLIVVGLAAPPIALLAASGLERGGAQHNGHAVPPWGFETLVGLTATTAGLAAGVLVLGARLVFARTAYTTRDGLLLTVGLVGFSCIIAAALTLTRF